MPATGSAVITRAAALGTVVLGAVTILAGCSSDDDDPPKSITIELAPTNQVVSGTTEIPVADRCTADELSLNLGRTDGSAGSVTMPLVFTNTGDRTCILSGFPGVSYVTAENGTEVGAAATRSGSPSGPVTLAPGGRATASVRAVQVLNYPDYQCGPTPVAGLHVYPPDDSAALFVAYPGTGCALPNVDQLQVTAVVPM